MREWRQFCIDSYNGYNIYDIDETYKYRKVLFGLMVIINNLYGPGCDFTKVQL